MKAGFLSLARELSSNSVSFTVLIRGEHTKGGPERFLVLGVGQVSVSTPSCWRTGQLSPWALSGFQNSAVVQGHLLVVKRKILRWITLCHLWTKSRSLWRLMDWAYLQVEHARVVVNHHYSLVCFLMLLGTNSAGWPLPLQLRCYVSFTEFFVSQQFQKRHCPSNSDNNHACLPHNSIYLSPFLLPLVVSTFSLHSDF